MSDTPPRPRTGHQLDRIRLDGGRLSSTRPWPLRAIGQSVSLRTQDRHVLRQPPAEPCEFNRPLASPNAAPSSMRRRRGHHQGHHRPRPPHLCYPGQSMTIYLDETGYTGQDLLNPDQPILVAASTNIANDVAASLVQECFPNLQARELKHSQLCMRNRGQDQIIRLLRRGLSRSLLNFGWRTPGLLYEVIYVTPRQQPRRRAEPARPGHRPGAADRGSPGPAGSASPPPPARSPPSVESSGHHASA